MRTHEMRMVFGFSLFLILIAMAAVQASDLEIRKTSPAEIVFGEALEVRIRIESFYDEMLSIKLTELADFGEPFDNGNLIISQNITQEEDGTVIINGVSWLKSDSVCETGCKSGDKICDPDCKCSAALDADCVAFVAPAAPRYEWDFTIKPGEKKEFSYRIKPYQIGFINISKTIAETEIGTFYSNELEVQVMCIAEGVCNKGENFGNCPEDCNSGKEDAYCDGAADGICDPDCPRYADLDCNPAICGDGKCEAEKNESYENCQQDCEKPVICGDSLCDYKKGENSLNCPQDCPSGRKDDYCDGIADKICDPDCARNLDQDCLCDNNGICEPEFENFQSCPGDCPQPIPRGPDYVLYMVLFIIVVFIAAIIYRRLKQRNEEE